MKIQDILQNPIVIAATTLGGLGLAFAIDWAKDHVGTSEMLAGIGLILLLTMGTVTLSILLSRSKRQEEFEDKINELKNIIIATHMSWLVSEKYVSNIEEHSENTWVFSTNLGKDLDENGDIFEAVEHNLKSGKKYTYFLPMSPEIIKSVNDFCTKHNFKKNQVLFYLIDPKEFNFYTDIYAYNTHAPKIQRVIELMPTESLNFFIELDEKRSNFIIGIGHTYLQNYEPYVASDLH